MVRSSYNTRVHQISDIQQKLHQHLVGLDLTKINCAVTAAKRRNEDMLSAQKLVYILVEGLLVTSSGQSQSMR